jgi:Domain of unknown function (DUF1821).
MISALARSLALTLTLSFALSPALAQEAPPPEREPPMTPARVADIVLRLDPEAAVRPGALELHVEDIPVLIVMDLRADRMRAMVPVRSATGLTAEELTRMMQANFDSALDARYAIAQDRVWSVFIHPLSSLDTRTLISGIGQTVNVAQTYGTLYSGGLLQYGPGDSAPLQRELIDRLLDRGQDI